MTITDDKVHAAVQALYPEAQKISLGEIYIDGNWYPLPSVWRGYAVNSAETIAKYLTDHPTVTRVNLNILTAGDSLRHADFSRREFY